MQQPGNRTAPVAIGDDAKSRLGSAHAKFARAALLIYLGAAAVSVTLLLFEAITDYHHETSQIVASLALQNEVRAQYIAQHMSLLGDELERLARRQEVNLDDHDLKPEESLLDFTHRESTFFNAGVAIVARDGTVLYADPAGFLPTGKSVARERWFSPAMRTAGATVAPAQAGPGKEGLLYVVAPIDRLGRVDGLLLGGLDLAREGTMQLEFANASIDTLVATREGTVLYPSAEPEWTHAPEFRDAVKRAAGGALLARTPVEGQQHVIAAVPVLGTQLLLLAESTPRTLFAPARHRMLTRIALGLVLAIAPLGALIFLLGRSLAVFRRNEQEAVREERLQMLGEASNLIAHEIKNSLNNLRVGIDVVLSRRQSAAHPAAPGGDAASASNARVFDELRREIQRLSEFTGELMTFSKGVAPRPADLDLCKFVPEVAALSRDAAGEVGASLEVVAPAAPVRVEADPALVHVVVGNLVSNAVDAVASRREGGGKVEVRIATEPGRARVQVVDNGPGVAASVREHLFEPFVTGKPSGVGIGLALSRKIARAHGGDLVLDPDAPGASFSLVLPLPSAAQAAASPHSPGKEHHA